ncbi:MAG: hypothetical protein KIT14_13055 [bacterium]|nr:hypothetical protein [bacterium]
MEDDAVILRPAGTYLLVRTRGDVSPRLPDGAAGGVWLTARDATGTRRRERLADWVRVEPLAP